jgi:hypothetical protein
MARKSYVQIDGRLYDKDSLCGSGASGAPAILGDLPDFVSPIDGQVVSGRAGLRDHCRRHGVVPTEELKGLPPKPVNLPYQPTQQERQQTRQVMADIINSRSDLRRHFKG